MDCKVIWTDPAIEDLGEIVRYIAADDPSSARRVGDDIIRTVELLQRFPLLGPPYAPVRDGSVREVLCWNYSISLPSLFLTKDCRDLDYLARRAKRTGTVKANKAIGLIDTRCHAGCLRTPCAKILSLWRTHL